MIDNHGRRAALVTGAYRGIGLAIARRLAADGFDLTISARSAEALEKAAVELREGGGRVVPVAADMSDERQLDALAAAHEQALGTLDVLVLSAGMGSLGPVSTYPLRRLDTMFAVNLRGPFGLTQRLLPRLREAAAGTPTGAKVIAVASLTGIAAEPGLGVYGASKAGADLAVRGDHRRRSRPWRVRDRDRARLRRHRHDRVAERHLGPGGHDHRR
jgi:3-oxoacyl-[acyl-carrier protein] reductase